MTEKRLYHRMNIAVPVCFESGVERKTVMSSTLDISATGLSLKLDEPLQVGEVLKITMSIDGNRTVKVEAQVVWAKSREGKDGMDHVVGLKVVDRMDQDEIEFVRFVAQKMFDYFKPEDEE